MRNTETITEIEGSTEEQINEFAATVEFESEYEDYYADWDTIPRQRRRFVRSLIAELEGIDTDSTLAENKANRALSECRVLDSGTVGEIGEFDAHLLIFPDDRRIFVGDDPTSKTSVSLFGFVVDPSEPIPVPSTVQEGIDLLKPSGVKQALSEGTTAPKRQGEWWLLETDEEPVGSVFKPGVSERPFGGSPLENHVPRAYGLGVPDDVFMERFENACPELADWVETPHEAFEQVWRGWEIAEFEGVELETDIPELSDIRKLAERIYVRGTLRHRKNEHYLENVGEGWNIAQTHHVEVYTADSLATLGRVRVD